MKLLPCDSRPCQGLGALLRPAPAYPDGEPFVSSGYCPTYKCHRCKLVTHLDIARYNALPELTLEDFKRLGMGDLPTIDLEGAGFQGEAARDLFKAGLWDTSDLHRLDRSQEAERQTREAMLAGATRDELAGEKA